jgi:hypothetical protein
MGAKSGLGCTLVKGVTNIGVMTGIKAPEKTQETIDTTTLDTADFYKTVIGGLLDGGEVTATGYYDITDAGQVALNTALEARTVDTYTITFPTTIGATFTFDALVTKVTPGECNLADAVGFEVTLKISGKPVLGVSASSGLSGLALTAAGGSLVPSYSASLRSYVFSGVSATSVTVTPTAAAHTIKLYVDGVYVQDVTSGAASAAIALVINVSKKITLVTYEVAKTPISYDITVVKTS